MEPEHSTPIFTRRSKWGLCFANPPWNRILNKRIKEEHEKMEKAITEEEANREANNRLANELWEIGSAFKEEHPEVSVKTAILLATAAYFARIAEQNDGIDSQIAMKEFVATLANGAECDTERWSADNGPDIS